ncbi:MAG: ferrous iron transport protein A [Anaerolineales bacterium]|nr:ferrous iron transport protein A [Anaerolineales bacterium]
MHLLQVDIGKTIRVVGFDGGRKLEYKLRQLGVLPGNCARILRQAPLGGPVMIEVDGRSIAIGRGIASKINVEEEAAPCDSR